MKTIKAFLAALLFALAATAAAQGGLPVETSPRTLVLYSYGYGARGVEVFSDSFIQESLRQGESVADTYFEYLDLERNKDPEYRSRLIAFLRQKYQNRNIAAIVTVQQPALGFLLSEGQSLAPNAPAIAAQAPIPAPDALKGRKVISLLARFDIEETLRRALQIFPSTRRVVFVSGSSDADKMAANDAWNAAAAWRPRIEFEFTVDQSIAAIQRRVATLPANSIIVFTQYNTDGKGHFAPAYEVEAMLVKQANAPVFGLYDFNLKNGGVGGSVISVTNLGVEAARLAQGVERGKLVPPDAITQKEIRPAPIFDWAQMTRWGGDTSAVSADAIILNKPVGIWELYRTAVVGTVAMLLVLSSLVVALAISRRRMARTRLALRQSESHFRGIFERIADAVIVADLGRKIVSVNPAFARLFGYRPEEVIGQPVQRLYADPATYTAMVNQVFNEQAAPADTTFEIECRRQDGSTFWSEVKGVALRDPAGKVTGYMSVDRDITNRKAWYVALSRFKAIVDSSDDAIISESPGGAITSWNAAAERILGYQASEAIGKPIQMLVPPDRTGEEANIMFRIERGQPIEHYETVRQRKDGRLIDLSVSVSPILDEAGNVTGASRIARDITERKRTAAALEQHRANLERMVTERTQDLSLAKAQAEMANAAKSTFLARMSHEIRTPMNGIIGLAYLLQRQLTDPRYLDKLNKIQDSARHLLALINDILDLSKIEAGRLSLEETDFNLPDLLEEIAAIVGPQAEAKGLRLERDWAEMPPWLRGDPTRLRQALLNYVGNAVKFTERGTVSLKCRVVEEAADAIVLRFEVIDTGIGIPSDKLGSLFQPFEQADTSISRDYGGTGLGLAINGYLAGLMGGQVGASSTAGEGSTFWFTARLLRALRTTPPLPAPSAAEAISELRRRHFGARVLLVEDNPISAEVAADLIGDAGLLVVKASDGEHAVAEARSAAYDLVLMDMRMPRMDGLAATRAIRALPGWAVRPIIALSANAFAEDRRRCLEAGMNDFIGKPMQPDGLYRMVLKWLDAGRTQADTAIIAQAGSDDVPHPGRSAETAQAELERIAGLPGMEHERVMNFRTKAGRYIELLRALVARHGQDMSRVTACLQAGDTESAIEIAHSLKGAAAMLGANELMLMAADLVTELRVRPNGRVDVAAVEPEVEAVTQALMALAAGLGVSLPEAA